MVGWLVFKGIATLVGYLMPNPVYTYTSYTVYSTPLTFLQIFKYISSWDNNDKMTLWHNEK